MKRYLLDTSALSLMAPGRSGLSPALIDWFRTQGEQLFISTITVAEVQQGISKLRRTGAEQRARLLTEWLFELIETGAEKVVGFHADAALKAGAISDAAISQGRYPGLPDVAIAALAAVGNMVVLTLNAKHFELLGVNFADPSKPAFLAAEMRE